MRRGVCAVAAALFALSAGAVPAGPPLADYPQAHWLAASSSNYTTANRPLSGPINMVVIHVTDGSYTGTLPGGIELERAVGVRERQDALW